MNFPFFFFLSLDFRVFFELFFFKWNEFKLTRYNVGWQCTLICQTTEGIWFWVAVIAKSLIIIIINYYILTIIF